MNNKNYPRRYIKNYLINKDFQIKFLLRFFIFSFIILSIGCLIQIYFSKKIINNKLEEISKDVENRKVEVIARLMDYEINGSTFKISKDDQQEDTDDFELEKGYLKDEINFIRFHVDYIKSVIDKDINILGFSFWISILSIGLFFNFIFSFFYGILLSHKIAGNHYRLEKFAKQLQNKDLKTPLVIRKKDFFQNTSVELEKARELIFEDFKSISSLQEMKENEIIKKYKL